MRTSASGFLSLLNRATDKNLGGAFRAVAALVCRSRPDGAADGAWPELCLRYQQHVHHEHHLCLLRGCRRCGHAPRLFPHRRRWRQHSVDRITVSPSRNLLFVSNSGDKTISVFTINPTAGVLTAVPGSPFASGLTP